MASNKTYTVAGISFYKEAFRLRTSNNLASRQATLVAMGDEEINLVELPRAMTKPEVVLYLNGHIDFTSDGERAVIAHYMKKFKLDTAAADPATAALDAAIDNAEDSIEQSRSGEVELDEVIAEQQEADAEVEPQDVAAEPKKGKRQKAEKPAYEPEF